MFFDEFLITSSGYINAQYRQRQKDAIDYAHSRGLKVFVNAWEPDDVFVKEAGNPISGVTGDKYLYESYVFSFTTTESFTSYRTKADKLKTASSQTGVEIYAVNTTAAADSAFAQADFDYMILSAAADGFHGIGWGTDNFSATTATMPFRTNTDLLISFANPTISIDTTLQTISVSHPKATFKLDYSATSYLAQ